MGQGMQRGPRAIKKIYSAARSFRYCRAAAVAAKMQKITEGAALVSARGTMTRALFCFFAFAAMTAAARGDDFPPGSAHDLISKACTQCHDSGMVTSQHMNAVQWSDTVKQMISNGAQISADRFDEVVAYLTQNFGAAATKPAGQAVPRSKNDVPYYASLQWRMEEGKPIETRWPEKQDDAPNFLGPLLAPERQEIPGDISE